MRTYFRHKIQNLITINEILTIEYLNFDKDYSFEEEEHDFWELVYCDKKNVVCQCGGQEIVLNEGEILFHSPNEAHSIHADGINSPSVFVLCFVCNSESMGAFKHYHKKLNTQNTILLANIIDEMKRTFVFPFNRKLVLLQNPILGGQEVIKNYLELLLIFLLREKAEQRTTLFLSEQNYEKQLALLIEQYLRGNIYASLSIPDICKHFNYSKAYISRIFKTYFSETLINYYNKLKIEEAKKLLTKEHLPVSQISDMLCFTDPHYFSIFFKKSTGISPSRYETTLNKE